MRPRDVVRYEDRLDALFAKTGILQDDELRADWARYLCVLTCGYVEAAVCAIFSEFASKKSAPAIARFVHKKLEKFCSPKHGSIIALASVFSVEWAEQLRANTLGEIKDHVDSLVANRHLIAHGRDSNVTIARVSEWFGSAKKLVRALEAQCGLG
jgi:hypothetical protein